VLERFMTRGAPAMWMAKDASGAPRDRMQTSRGANPK
jgi:hypothetical protein